MSATFVPADTTNYNSPTDPVTTTITVNKATPVVTSWPTTSRITDGSSLSTAILSGGGATANDASVAGTFAWTNPSTIPAIGTNSYMVTFPPTDAVDFNTVTGTVGVSMSQASTSTGLQSNSGQLMFQSPVMLTATVTTSSGNPAGTISFVEGATPLGSAPLSNGVANLTVSTLAAGTHIITAMYSGDSTYAGSSSSATSVPVIDLSTIPTVPGGSGDGKSRDELSYLVQRIRIRRPDLIPVSSKNTFEYPYRA